MSKSKKHFDNLEPIQNILIKIRNIVESNRNAAYIAITKIYAVKI